MSSHNEPSISFLVRRSFDLAKFNALIDVGKEEISVAEQNMTEISLQSIKENLRRIVTSLLELRKLIKNIDHIGKKTDYDINWIFEGSIELTSIFSSIDVLEYNVNLLLTKFENVTGSKTESLLDDISAICDLSVEIKKLIYPYKKRLAIANHHKEIEKEVLASVKNEITYCVEKLKELESRKQLVDIATVIQGWKLEDFRNTSKNLDIGAASKYNGLIIVSSIDAQIFDSYTTLHETILPISQSLKLIPRTLEDFYHNARIYYQDLVLENIAKYEEITTSYENYRQGLRAFRNDYITHRIELICENVFEQVDGKRQPANILECVLDVLKPIDNFYGLNEVHSSKLKAIEDQLYNVPLEENIKTPPPKNRKLRSKRVFSNPLVDSLNMKPILSESRIKKRPDIKIFQTPRNIDDDHSMKANLDILQRIKTDISDTSVINTRKLADTPVIFSSPQSSDSSPDTMRTRNIFDSPDPFITPNSRSFQKSRLPISTPLTTPRVTPTKNHSAIATNVELRDKKESLLRSNVHTPLLRFELSTIVNVDSKKNEEIGVLEVRRGISKLSLTPTQIPTPPKQKPSRKSPSFESSKIPLPKRPESRLNMLRSVSRLQNDRIKVERSPIQNFGRSDSRLENIASSISLKLGTDSPVSISEQKVRPATVMTQRELRPQNRPFQLGRPKGNHSSELRSIKTRGATSLGARFSEPSSRISSI